MIYLPCANDHFLAVHRWNIKNKVDWIFWRWLFNFGVIQDVYPSQYHFVDVKTKYIFRSYLKIYTMGSEKVECRFSYEELKMMGDSK